MSRIRKGDRVVSYDVATEREIFATVYRHLHALKTSLGADYRAGYTYGASDFQERAIKQLTNQLNKAHRPDFENGLEAALDIIKKLKP